MGYLSIDNLYKNTKVLEFEEVFALEKIHGTSAHIKFKTGVLSFFSGGEKYDNFIMLFNQQQLQSSFEALGQDEIIVYGESYGGKMQGMRNTYGDDIKFVVFDVKMNGNWLDVPTAKTLAKYLKLEFVDYVRIPATLEKLNEERDKPSTQALRNGRGADKIREGIVIRPIRECIDERGNRIIAKHKREQFRETKKPREVNPESLEVLKRANAIADEWVTEERLRHILSGVQALLNNVMGFDGSRELSIDDMGTIIKMMVEDVEREAKGEIVESKEARKAISNRAVKLYKNWLKEKFKEKFNV